MWVTFTRQGSEDSGKVGKTSCSDFFNSRSEGAVECFFFAPTWSDPPCAGRMGGEISILATKQNGSESMLKRHSENGRRSVVRSCVLVDLVGNWCQQQIIQLIHAWLHVCRCLRTTCRLLPSLPQCTPIHPSLPL